MARNTAPGDAESADAEPPAPEPPASVESGDGPPPTEPGTPPPVGNDAASTGQGAAGEGTRTDTGSQPVGEGELEPAGKFVAFCSWAIVGSYLLASALLTALAVIAHFEDDKQIGIDVGRWWALVFGVGSVALGLLVLQLIGLRKQYGIFRPIIGADRRFSTSLTQLGLWTIAIATGFAYLLGRVIFDDASFDTVIPGALWDEYLLLLGGPFAAAVVSKGIVTYKLSAGTLQKSEAADPSPSQVVRGDDGSADLVDAQYLLFNVIALVYFVVRLAGTSVLPQIPAPLLALTGATAAAYVANKAAQRNAPTITSVSPSTAEPGDLVTIYGMNFDPADHSDSGRRITVTLSGYTDTIYANAPTDTRVRFRIPATAASGDQTVQVTSTAGVQTEPHDLQVRSKAASITGLADPPALRPGAQATLIGRNLGRPGEPTAVQVGKIRIVGLPNETGTELTIDVPNPITSDQPDVVAVTVTVPGDNPVTETLPIEVPSIRSAWRSEQGIHVACVALHRGRADFKPRILVNGHSSTEVTPENSDTYLVSLPAGIDGSGELALIAMDDLGRPTPEFRLGAAS